MLVASTLEPFDIDPTRSLETAFTTIVDEICEHTGGKGVRLVERVGRLHAQAISYLGSSGSLQRKEREILAAVLVMSDSYNLIKLFNEPEIYIHNETLSNFTVAAPLIHPAYAGFRPRDAASISPSRSLEFYPRPPEMTLLEFVGGLIRERGRINLLEVGVGSGAAITYLKDVFGDKVMACGCGVDNYTIGALDYQYVGPIETAPFASGMFDVIISNYTSCYFTYPTRAYHQIARMAKTGGHMFLDVSPRYNLTLLEITEIAAHLLDITTPTELNQYIQAQYGMVFGWEEEQVLSRLQHFMNVRGQDGRYQVQLADGRDCRTYPVWITKS